MRYLAKNLIAVLLIVCLSFSVACDISSYSNGKSSSYSAEESLSESYAKSDDVSASHSKASGSSDNSSDAQQSTSSGDEQEETSSEQTQTSLSADDSQSSSSSDDSQSSSSSDDYTPVDPTTEYDFTITYSKGTQNAYEITYSSVQDEYLVTFTTITEKTVYSMSGTLKGSVIVDVGDDYKFELEMSGLTVSSVYNAPIVALSGDEFTLTAKKDTENFIYDNRADVSEDETAYGSAVYSVIDMTLGGKGSLTVNSTNNNGVHTKDDLEVKNMTLSVNCVDNALKGNDSVTVTSGNLTLIARQGDGIKTSNSSIKYNDDGSFKKYKGIIEIDGGTLNIYAACDGIDAAYDVIITQTLETTPTVINIYTDKYSEYSEEVTAVSNGEYYLRSNTSSYNYSVYYYSSSDASVYTWANATYASGGMQGRPGGSSSYYYYYKVDKPSSATYDKMIVYAYSSSQTTGQAVSYYAKSSAISQNDNYDTLSFTVSSSNVSSVRWTNYTTTTPGAPGGMQDGNTDKGDYSTKGIKADNQITISDGTITIKSYDDAIHANNDVTLESGLSPLGNVTISGGSITAYSNDDGLHADGTLSITDGTIKVTNSYEGLEGTYIRISGGEISVKSSDDGVNGTTTSGTALEISGGYLYVYAGGDGLDCNSQTQKTGMIISGGMTIVVSTSGGNSSLDTDKGYTVSGGFVLAVCPQGMTSEVQNVTLGSGCYSTTKTGSFSASSYLVVDGVVVLKMPTNISNGFAIYLGETNSSITTTSSSTYSFDDNGVYRMA